MWGKTSVEQWLQETRSCLIDQRDPVNCIWDTIGGQNPQNILQRLQVKTRQTIIQVQLRPSWEKTVSPFQGDIIIITSRRKKLFFLEWGFLKRADQLQLQLQRHTYINKKCRANFFFKRRLAAAKRVKHSKAKIYSSPEWPLVEKNYFFWNLFSVLCCHRLPLFLRKLVIWHLRIFSCFFEDCKRWSVETGR